MKLHTHMHRHYMCIKGEIKKDRRTYKHTHTYTDKHTFRGRAPDILQSTLGAGETVMDYRHIWAVISRSRIPPAFSRREKSCIMVSHRRPGTLGCIMPCQRACVCLVISGFSTQSRIKQYSKAFHLLCSKTFDIVTVLA